MSVKEISMDVSERPPPYDVSERPPLYKENAGQQDYSTISLHSSCPSYDETQDENLAASSQITVEFVLVPIPLPPYADTDSLPSSSREVTCFFPPPPPYYANETENRTVSIFSENIQSTHVSQHVSQHVAIERGLDDAVPIIIETICDLFTTVIEFIPRWAKLCDCLNR